MRPVLADMWIPLLRSCSLGKLSYIVQLAVNCDYLRYQKTLLVWKNSSSKPKTDFRLKKVKRLILDILKENVGGISLAQLPLQMRKKLGYHLDMPSLGFAKLKDLLVTMNEVLIEQKGMNNPTACLKKKRSFDVKRAWRGKKNASVDLDSFDLSTNHSKASSNISDGGKAVSTYNLSADVPPYQESGFFDFEGRSVE